MVAVTAKFLVDSVDGFTVSRAISKEFVHVILLPILGKTAKLVAAVTLSAKDELVPSLDAIVGSSMVSEYLR